MSVRVRPPAPCLCEFLELASLIQYFPNQGGRPINDLICDYSLGGTS